MRIGEVIRIHKSFKAEYGQDDVLGDSFLLKTNPIYRAIKAFALKIGCVYREAWPQYLLLPFHQLDHIISTKTIPYVPHGRMLQEVEAKRPGTFTTDDMKMPESYHLHESAHVIADHLFQGIQFTDPRERILRAILCESFANTIDALTCVPAADEMHRFFLEHNCYMHPQKKNIDVMARLIKSLGLRCTFMLILLSYVHSNFLVEPLSKKQIEQLLNQYALNCEIDAKILKDCKAIGTMTEKLDPRFRVQTIETYLKLEGYKGQVFEIMNFPFMTVYESNQAFRKAAEAMASVVESENLFT